MLRARARPRERAERRRRSGPRSSSARSAPRSCVLRLRARRSRAGRRARRPWSRALRRPASRAPSCRRRSLVALGAAARSASGSPVTARWRAQLLASAPGALVLGAVAARRVGRSGSEPPSSVSTVVAGALVGRAANRVVPRWSGCCSRSARSGCTCACPTPRRRRRCWARCSRRRASALEPRLRRTVGRDRGRPGCSCGSPALGGLGRPGSVVGGIACLGVVLLLPLVALGRRVARGACRARRRVQCALVAFVSRVAGFEDRRVAARSVLAIPAFVVALLSCWCSCAADDGRSRRGRRAR